MTESAPSNLSDLRSEIRRLHRADEAALIAELCRAHAPDAATRATIAARATRLIEQIREDARPGLMEVFLAEYGLSTDEGVALMCLAEALLRVPDVATIDELIEDKIAPSSWGAHLGQSSSPLVNASTWALMLTGKVLQDPGQDGLADTLHSALKRLGEPVIRAAVRRAMREMGSQFVLGEDISAATKRAATEEEKGYSYSYDMLGEAALTAQDARGYFQAYHDAIAHLASRSHGEDPRANPGISIKLSALHPRYEEAQKARVMAELVPRVTALARQARAAQMGLNIDAEEADRLELSLDVIEAVLRDETLAGWDGFGVVVQAYGKRAGGVIDWLHALAQDLDRKLMVRLVKGAYWDGEIKRAQVDGVPDFPVFTSKAATDVSFICCADKLLSHSDRIYPQFATHNAHTVAAILQIAGDNRAYEFQRLHGMGEALHDLVVGQERRACRIYAPVGAHRDLLAYLVRRLLENGANSSFVNQLVDEDVSATEIAADPFAALGAPRPDLLRDPAELFAPERVNSAGWDLQTPGDAARYEAARAPFAESHWEVGPEDGEAVTIRNPARPDDAVGTARLANAAHAQAALGRAQPWSNADATARRAVLDRVAELYEAHAGEIFALLAREAGKAAPDAVAELREAVDFLRFYGAEAARSPTRAPRGLITCISPWNFPLAIFTGQIAAALAAGNAVLAKPADPTPLIAGLAVRLMHEAGVPETALQLLPGTGEEVGRALTTDPRISGICFTGSTRVAQIIHRAAAEHLPPEAPLIAETGGLNAMLVDSTSLPEQAVRDIVLSAFRSTGQRCSACRVLYVQADVADRMIAMLKGAMDELSLGDSWQLNSDLGPVITAEARAKIAAHIEKASGEGRLLHQGAAPADSLFLAPALLEIDSIADLGEEIFGPVLHVARFEAHEIDAVIDAINATGYGLTFGLHSRIDDRVEQITSRIAAGNVYVNRNQIGAVVGSQPFGGEGLSGTGPKAGGPLYLGRFYAEDQGASDPGAEPARSVPLAEVETALAALPSPHAATDFADLPGPTGEANRWSAYPRGRILCLGPSAGAAREQARQARDAGCTALAVAPGIGAEGIDGGLELDALSKLTGFDAVALWSARDDLRAARQALAARSGPILPLITAADLRPHLVIERHLCIDTTAAGGNTALLAAE